MWLQKDNRHEFGHGLMHTNVGYLEKLNDVVVVVVAERNGHEFGQDLKHANVG